MMMEAQDGGRVRLGVAWSGVAWGGVWDNAVKGAYGDRDPYPNEGQDDTELN